MIFGRPSGIIKHGVLETMDQWKRWCSYENLQFYGIFHCHVWLPEGTSFNGSMILKYCLQSIEVRLCETFLDGILKWMWFATGLGNMRSSVLSFRATQTRNLVSESQTIPKITMNGFYEPSTNGRLMMVLNFLHHGVLTGAPEFLVSVHGRSCRWGLEMALISVCLKGTCKPRSNQWLEVNLLGRSSRCCNVLFSLDALDDGFSQKRSTVTGWWFGSFFPKDLAEGVA